MLAASPSAWAALITLTVMEIVLGIDNLIFISVITNRLPEHQRSTARKIGISAALILRLILLSLVAFIVQLNTPIITLFEQGFSWRDLIFIGGGLFLVWKATKEIHHYVDPDPKLDSTSTAIAKSSLSAVVAQILLLDAVFSIDSIISAVGMTEHIPLMVIAVVTTVIIMLIAADSLAEFIRANPTIVMLALGFLLLIGTTLIAEGFGAHIPKGYIYAAMAFSALVESLNMLSRRAHRKRANLSS